MRRVAVSLGMALALALALIPGASTTDPTTRGGWMVVGLGKLPPWPCSGSVAISPQGSVVGWTSHLMQGAAGHAFLWRGGNIADLGALPGASSSKPTAINAEGDVIGDSPLESGGVRAFVWHLGRMTNLGQQTIAVALNEKGQVVVTGPGPLVRLWKDGRWTPFRFGVRAINNRGQIVTGGYALWDNGRLSKIDVQGLSKLGEIHIRALNDKGQILINTSRFHPEMGLDNPGNTTNQRAFLWQNGRLTSLPGRVEAIGINEHGQIAGNRILKDGTSRGFLWENGKMIDLGSLGDGRTTAVSAINERGQIIGTRAPQRAFVWDSGHLTLLPLLPGDTSSEVAAINDKGQIVGTSIRGGQYHAVIWTHAS
jgi:probable HAF family extracellular repeat protein